MIIGIDFDGTLSKHQYPNIGEEVPNSIDTCKKLIKDGHKLILYTMRSGKELKEAVEWCTERGLEFWGINENPQQKTWTTSPKIYCQLYIDDNAYTSYLIYPKNEKPYVDWQHVYNFIK